MNILLTYLSIYLSIIIYIDTFKQSNAMLMSDFERQDLIANRVPKIEKDRHATITLPLYWHGLAR